MARGQTFLALDDRSLGEEAAPLHPASVVPLPFAAGGVQFPGEFELHQQTPGAPGLQPTLILLWTPENKRVLTALDLLELLLRGVAADGGA